MLVSVISIFLAGLATLSWADARYAARADVETERDQMRLDIREMKKDIKEILGRVK